MDEFSNTILLVEDNEDDIFAVRRAFQRAAIGNDIQVVQNGREAIEYLSGEGKYADRAEYPLPFLVLLDLKVPLISGFEVLAWIREQFMLTSVVVVVLTSSDEAKDHRKAYALGARSYLLKPATADDLKEVLNSLQPLWTRFGTSGPFVPARV